jgi:hypothetical protein
MKTDNKVDSVSEQTSNGIEKTENIVIHCPFCSSNVLKSDRLLNQRTTTPK